MIRQLHIWDMDGTIVDSSHRYRVNPETGNIDLPYWMENEHKVMEDSLLPLADFYRNTLADNSIYTIIATARIWCDLTEQFVRDRLGYPDKVVGRVNHEDTRGGAELKIQAIRPLLNLKQFQGAQIHVFEDNATYLKKICDTLGGIGHYYPSVQGH